MIAKAAGLTLYREDKTHFTNSDDLLVNGVGLVMKIERSKQRTITEEADVNFDIEQIKDDSQPIGFKSVKQLGEKGVRKVTYQVEVENEREISRKEVASEITKQPKKQIEIIGTKPKNPLTKSKGAQIFTDSKGVAHRETYYDLPMNIVIKACGSGGTYTVRADGAKVDKDGYILVAANYGNYPAWVRARFTILADLQLNIRTDSTWRLTGLMGMGAKWLLLMDQKNRSDSTG